MRAIIEPKALSGEIAAPSSKSEAHRLLICAAIAEGTTNVECATSSRDIDATIDCLEALGARITRTKDGYRVVPVPRSSACPSRVEARADAPLDCCESGSTLRFMLPIACALGSGASLTGQGRLPERPLSPLYERLVEHGAHLSEQGAFPLRVSGCLRGGTFELPGNVSSQYVSGLLMAAPLTGDSVEVVVSEPVESRPYIDLTTSALAAFGVSVSETVSFTSDGRPARSWQIQAPATMVSPGSVRVGGDWSNAAFWLAAGALAGSGVAVLGLDPQSPQGDKNALAALSLLGARVLRRRDGAACSPGELSARTIDVRDIPDLVPPLAAVAAFAHGTSRFVGAERLKIKESDRLASVSNAINSLGGRASQTADGLVIEGREALPGGTVDAMNDHRIAMMAAIMAARCTGAVTIKGAECVSKSYPAFFEDLVELGGVCRKEN